MTYAKLLNVVISCIKCLFLAGATIELIGPSLEDGELFIIEEGETLTLLIAASGFSYGNIPLNVSLITYSDYAALGFTLEDEFSSALVPEDAASCKLQSYFESYTNINFGLIAKIMQ